MDFNAIWAQIQPYVIMGVQLLMGVGAIAGTLKAAKSGVVKLFNQKAADLNSASLVEGITEKVVKRLSKTVLSVDLKTVAEKKLIDMGQDIKDEVIKQFQPVFDAMLAEMRSVKVTTVGTADLLVRSKEMTDAARASLLAEITAARGEIQQEPREEIVISLDSEEPEPVEAPKAQDASHAGTIALG